MCVFRFDCTVLIDLSIMAHLGNVDLVDEDAADLQFPKGIVSKHVYQQICGESVH